MIILLVLRINYSLNYFLNAKKLWILITQYKKSLRTLYFTIQHIHYRSFNVTICFLIANTPGIEVNFQLTSVTITEGVPLANFTIIISGGNPMMVLGSTTTVFLTTVDGSASELRSYIVWS